MGNTYTVPRSMKGETRILIKFTVRSLITTILFGMIGLIPYMILSIFNFGIVGLICLVLFALLGFGIGTLEIPDSPMVGKLRKAGGEKVSDILIRFITFKFRFPLLNIKGKKNIYVYREDDKIV